MRVAVISDIHANLPALEAVLAEIDRDPPDELWCLGDLVGYGPHPNEVVAIVRGRADVCLAGNHDLGVIGRIGLQLFGGEAGAAARWTSGVIEAEARDYLAALEPQGSRSGIGLYHASPRDPVWEYVLDTWTAARGLEAAPERHVLVGHSHVALEVAVAEDGTQSGGLAPPGTEVPLDELSRLLNPGSVGQPRDGDPRASYAVLDVDRTTVDFHRVAYDVPETQKRMRALKLPDMLAERLAFGL
jgi:predicted phosphodiesterase